MPKDPIRIAALVEAATVTGPAKNLIRFARENPHLVDIRILTFVRGGHEPRAANPFIDAARSAGLTVEVIPERRRFDWGVVARLKQLFATHEPDVVQTHSVKSHFLVALLGSSRPRPWIAFHHGYTNENFKMRIYNSLDRYSLRHSDRMLTVCEAFVPELERCGVARDKVDILHNCIDPAWGDAAVRTEPDEVAQFRASLTVAAGNVAAGAAPRIVRILAAGRLSKEKGHGTLIEAVVEVKRRRPDLAFEVLLAGDGPLRRSLVALSKAREVETVIRFVGQIRNIRAFFDVADVMALPSFSEGSPNVVLEAMAARVPVVATRVGGVPEILRDRETALLVRPGDSAALAAALIEMIGSAELRSRLADRAHEHVVAEFTPARYDARVMAVYQKALAAANGLPQIRQILTVYRAIDTIVTTMVKAGCAIALLGAALVYGQPRTPTAAEALKRNFDYINGKILEMAQDFPAEKYDYKLRPEMRTFGAVIVHLASGNIYAAKAGNGEKVKWDDQEQDAAKYPSKAECVALLKKSIEDANAALKANPEGPQKNMQPFLSVLQHASEHYGLLVAYYRANGLVPPDSRPKK